MRDQELELQLDSTLSVKIEAKVLKTIQEMEKYTKISSDELVNTALKRFIATHKDYLPPKAG